MSYSNPIVEVNYDGDGIVDSFAVPFAYLEGETADILVQLWDFTDPLLPIQLGYILNIDYTVDESGFPATIINTVTIPPVNFKLTIQRATPTIQTTNFATGSFPAESVEEALDRAMFSNQEKEAVLDRAIVNPIGATPITTTDLQTTITASVDNAADIATNMAGIIVNQSDIGTNQSAIATNASGVSTNAANVSTNAADISTNASNISTNAADIATNVADIAALSVGSSAEQVVSVALAGTHNASSREIVIIKSDNVTVALPSPAIHETVKVKMDGLRASAIITSGATIDGNATYPMLSDNESVSLVSDGTNWFII